MSDDLIQCDVCGKEWPAKLDYPHTAGIVFYTPLLPLRDDESRYAIYKQCGEYKTNRKYYVCWECYLKAFGVKP